MSGRFLLLTTVNVIRSHHVHFWFFHKQNHILCSSKASLSGFWDFCLFIWCVWGQLDQKSSASCERRLPRVDPRCPRLPCLFRWFDRKGGARLSLYLQLGGAAVLHFSVSSTARLSVAVSVSDSSCRTPVTVSSSPSWATQHAHSLHSYRWTTGRVF